MVITRREFLRQAGLATGAIGLGALLGGCGIAAAPTPTPAAAAKPSRAFTFAYLTLGWAGTEVIHKQGLLARRGWNIEWQTVGPISGVVNAFASGQVGLADMSMTIAAQMHENGVPLKVVGTAVATLGAIVVPADSPIATVADLRGRRVGGIPGSTTTQDINASVRKVHGFDLLTDTRFVQATAPPDLTNLLLKREVEAALLWEPLTSQVQLTDRFRVLATQQEMWERASGSPGKQVHVVYLTTPQIAAEFPTLVADINAAQAEVVDLWQRRDPAALDAIMQVTQLPKEVVDLALNPSTPLHGLTDEQVQTMLAQLKHNREHGTILKSDLWLDPAKARDALFVRA